VDRELIQRRDFPTGRRGYDIAAVDEHLRRVADAFEHNAPVASPSLAATTAEQVRSILEAAERSVSEVRAQAGRDASDHVARVQSAADGMLAKLDQLESELTRLMTSLRAAGEQLTEGLAALQADVAQGAPRDAVPAVETPPAADPAPPDGGDAGARLVALNMALSGSSREETAAYLAEHFALADAEALLDDVYARAGR
jgi:DivIVA domain-containing protein